RPHTAINPLSVSALLLACQQAAPRLVVKKLRGFSTVPNDPIQRFNALALQPIIALYREISSWLSISNPSPLSTEDAHSLSSTCNAMAAKPRGRISNG